MEIAVEAGGIGERSLQLFLALCTDLLYGAFFGFEFFADAGNVWARPQYIRARDFVLPWQATRVSDTDLRWAYGAGARLVLPFGPLRIDLARADRPDFPFTTRHGRPLPFTFQFAIGPSF